MKNICPHGINKDEIQESFAFAGGVAACECCTHFYGHFGGIGSERCYPCRDSEFLDSLKPLLEKQVRSLKKYGITGGSFLQFDLYEDDK